MADFDVRLTRGAEIDLEALHGFVTDNRSAEQADALLDRLLCAIETRVTNVRNTAAPHRRRWLVPASRCLVPFTAFSEPGLNAEGKSEPVWFAMDESRPLAFFAGIWTG